MLHRFGRVRLRAALVFLAGLLLLGLVSAVLASGLSSSKTASAARRAADVGPAVLVVAHEGGRSPATARQSLAWGADIIEMDVVAYHDQLYVSHHSLSSHQARLAPTVGQMWPIAAHARIVELDLKQSSPTFRRLLVTFLRTHRGAAPQIFVSSRSVATLQAVKTGAPWVFRFLSIGDACQWRALRADPALAAQLDGVSIDQTLLDPAAIGWLHAHHLLVFAWTVDSPDRAQELMREGVDAITTDQPGIVVAIARQERGARHVLLRAVQ